MVEIYEINGVRFELTSMQYGYYVVIAKIGCHEFKSEFLNKYSAMEFILSHALKGVNF